MIIFYPFAALFLCPHLWPRLESNQDIKFRKLTYYPLYYGANKNKARNYDKYLCGFYPAFHFYEILIGYESPKP